MENSELIRGVEGAVRAWGRRPTWDEYFICAAILMASRSACERLHVGCVIVSGGEHKNRIVAAGYNGFLPGAPHSSCVRDGHEQATVHAEQNALIQAARMGVSVYGATMYVTYSPCIICARLLINAGIVRVIYRYDYPDEFSKEILKEAGVELIKFDPDAEIVNE